MSELKPCAFCSDGGSPKLAYGFAAINNPNDSESPIHTTRYHVYCQECQASSPMRNSPLEAIEAWNARYQPICKMVNGPWGEDELYPAYDFICTHCGKTVWAQEKPRYCPHCGALVLDGDAQ